MPSTRILVVDDSPTIRKVVTSILDRHGFEAVSATDGQHALEAIDEAQGNFDLVLVDFVMPKMNGYQFCRALRARSDLSIPVVLMSAKSDKIREQFVQQTGAIDAISKPFDATALVAVIENAVKRSAQWRARGDALAAGMPENFVPHESVRPPPVAGADGAIEAKRPPALAGDLAVIPIGAVLQLIQIESLSGVLTIANGRSEIAIALRKGLIDLVLSRGAGQEFRLGRYFVENGLMAETELERFILDARKDPNALSGERHAASPTTPRDGTPAAFVTGDEPTSVRKVRVLGEMLVSSGKVTTEQLNEALARQSSELIYEAVRWERGRFEFRREPPPALAESAKLALPVASVVMEGFRRVDEWRIVEAGLGSFDAVLQVDPVALDALGEANRLAKAERAVLDCIDGERSVREIVRATNMSSFDACKILFQLLEARLVRRRAA